MVGVRLHQSLQGLGSSNGTGEPHKTLDASVSSERLPPPCPPSTKSTYFWDLCKEVVHLHPTTELMGFKWKYDNQISFLAEAKSKG